MFHSLRPRWETEKRSLRSLSYRNGISEMNTLARIPGLSERKHFQPHMACKVADKSERGPPYLLQSMFGYWVSIKPLPRLLSFRCLPHTHIQLGRSMTSAGPEPVPPTSPRQTASAEGAGRGYPTLPPTSPRQMASAEGAGRGYPALPPTSPRQTASAEGAGRGFFFGLYVLVKLR